MKDVMTFLMRDELLNADIIDCLRFGGEVIKSTDDGVLVRTAKTIYAIDALSKESYIELGKYVPKEKGVDICAHQPRFAPVLAEGRSEDTKLLPCWEYVHSKELIEEKKLDGISFRELNADDLPFVYDNYGETKEYIDRCFKGGMIGAFEGEKCVGFIGLHPNGEVGLLQVLGAYRKRGIGTGLEARMTNRRIKEGHTPYNFVVVGNEASIKLQDALGYKKAERMVTWVLEK